jgi:hypothetical protein
MMTPTACAALTLYTRSTGAIGLPFIDLVSTPDFGIAPQTVKI